MSIRSRLLLKLKHPQYAVSVTIDTPRDEKEVIGEFTYRKESATNLKRLLKERLRTGYQIKASMNEQDSAILKDSLSLKEKDLGSFCVVTDFEVVENMDAYRDQDMGEVIVG
ncbi:hypothetical protein Tco_1161339, partial [Tanacetum coccineum]